MTTKLSRIENWSDLAQEVKWSTAGLAKRCGVSVRTLERHFLNKMGVCPQLWLSEQRQHRAIELLKDGSMVKEVADHLGYKYATNFSREFKEYWGHPPTSKLMLPQNKIGHFA